MVNTNQRTKFNSCLYHWYRKNARCFPWREKHELYPLLVAEILLQKTNADKVVPAYEEILKRYPTPERLANAHKKTLERIITPLGLVSKSVILKSMAKRLSSWENKKLTRESLIGLKGVGDYMASSVLIHVNGTRCSILDPNFIRIYERVFGLSSNCSRPRTDKELWKRALELMPRKNVSRYVYSILDFGALVCRAKNPSCLECPMFSDVCLGVEAEMLKNNM